MGNSTRDETLWLTRSIPATASLAVHLAAHPACRCPPASPPSSCLTHTASASDLVPRRVQDPRQARPAPPLHLQLAVPTWRRFAGGPWSLQQASPAPGLQQLPAASGATGHRSCVRQLLCGVRVGRGGARVRPASRYSLCFASLVCATPGHATAAPSRRARGSCKRKLHPASLE